MPNDPFRPRRVLVGVDHSLGARLALEHAALDGFDGSTRGRAALAYAADGGLVVAVHAFQPPPDWLGPPYYQQDAVLHEADRPVVVIPADALPAAG